MTASPASPAAPPARGTGRTGPAVAVAATGVALVNLDLFIVNVVISDIGRAWPGTDLSALSWVLNAYAVLFAALLVPAGRLADRAGHRAVYLRGVALFTLASALCAAAPGIGWLVAARLAQAAGAAMLMPSSLGLLLATFPPERRAGAVRLWAALGGAAAAFGPVAGGLLASAGWRWVFLVNVPIGLATLAAARLLPDPPRADDGRLPDALGTALLVAGTAGVALVLTQSPQWGWGSGRALLTWAAALAALAWFTLRTRSHPRPLVEPALLRHRPYAAVLPALTLFSIAFGGMLLSFALWAQTVWGWSALRTGLAIAPGPAIVPGLSIAVGRVAARAGAARLVAAGCVFFAAGMAWPAIVAEPGSGYAGTLLPAMLLTGIGTGLALPTLVAASAVALPPERFATGSGVVSTVRQIAAVVGVSAVVAAIGTPEDAGAAREAFALAWYLLAAVALAAAASAPLMRRPAPVRTAAAPGAPAAPAAAAVPAAVSDGDPR